MWSSDRVGVRISPNGSFGGYDITVIRIFLVIEIIRLIIVTWAISFVRFMGFNILVSFEAFGG